MNSLREYSEKLISVLQKSPTIAVALIAAVTLSLVAVLTLPNFQSGTKQPLFNGIKLDSNKLVTIQLALAKAGLDDFEFAEGQIRVPKKERPQYLAVVEAAGCMPTGSVDEVEAELNRTPFFESNQQREVRLRHALERELAREVRSLDRNIERAAVRFDEAVERGLKTKRTLSANVKVMVSDGARLSERTVDAIRQMVAAEKIGLSLDDVTLTDLRSKDVYAGNGLQSAFAGPDGKQRWERQWERKIGEAVSFVPAARVNVSVEFKPAENLSPTSAAANQKPATAGTQGIAATATKQVEAPDKLAVFVNVPASYYHQLWRSKRLAVSEVIANRPNPDDLRTLKVQTEDKIEMAIRTLTSTTATTTQVTVTSYDDMIADSGEVASALVPAWFVRNRWVGLGIACAVIALAWSLRSFFAPKTPSENAVYAPRLYTEGHGAVPSDSLAESGEDNSGKEDELRDRLAEVVRNDPNAAARVIQNWMRQAS